jgi:CheY-like chemotaxis protein
MRTFKRVSLAAEENSSCKKTMLSSRPKSHHRPPGILTSAPARQALRTKGEVTGPKPQNGGADDILIKTFVADDSPFILKTLSSLLEGQGHIQLIGTATDGYRAVRRAMELKPDLVLIDLHLPGMNGLEATRRIKVHSSATAVIMVTADDTPEIRAAANAAGADGFVGKQHIFTQLPAAIRKLFPEHGASCN